MEKQGWGQHGPGDGAGGHESHSAAAGGSLAFDQMHESFLQAAGADQAHQNCACFRLRPEGLGERQQPPRIFVARLERI